MIFKETHERLQEVINDTDDKLNASGGSEAEYAEASNEMYDISKSLERACDALGNAFITSDDSDGIYMNYIPEYGNAYINMNYNVFEYCDDAIELYEPEYGTRV